MQIMRMRKRAEAKKKKAVSTTGNMVLACTSGGMHLLFLIPLLLQVSTVKGRSVGNPVSLAISTLCRESLLFRRVRVLPH